MDAPCSLCSKGKPRPGGAPSCSKLQADYSPAYRGIRTSDGRKYVEYTGGGKELYHLGRDTYELRDSYNPKDPPVTLAKRLKKLVGCNAAGCREAEGGQ